VIEGVRSVAVWLPEALVLHYAFKLFIGLSRLASQRGFELRFEPGLPRGFRSDGLVGAALEVTVRDGRHVRAFLDLQDQGALFDESALRTCDLYLKRGYEPKHLTAGLAGRERVAPLGLVHSCGDPRTLARVLWAWTRARRRHVDFKKELKLMLQLPRAAAFERGPESPASSHVIFQTRVWEPGESDPADLEQVNEGRALLVRTLRRALGPRFRGGLVPTPFAREHYGDLVVTESFRRTDYIAFSAGCAIGIYSRGLHHSNAFKLSEYLAAAQAIVAEPPVQGLPRDLVSGEDFLPYQDADGCAAQCERLLASSTLLRDLRHRSATFYRDEVAPEAHASRVLARITQVGRRPVVHYSSG
jgi:hypothetical protein